jgi:hypothetical protein
MRCNAPLTSVGHHLSAYLPGKRGAVSYAPSVTCNVIKQQGLEENMPPNFLSPESIVKGDGVGPKIDLGVTRGKLLVLTLGITRIIEQESLEVSVWGS